jgi:hypothetical protein
MDIKGECERNPITIFFEQFLDKFEITHEIWHLDVIIKKFRSYYKTKIDLTILNLCLTTITIPKTQLRNVSLSQSFIYDQFSLAR